MRVLDGEALTDVQNVELPIYCSCIEKCITVCNVIWQSVSYLKNGHHSSNGLMIKAVLFILKKTLSTVLVKKHNFVVLDDKCINNLI